MKIWWAVAFEYGSGTPGGHGGGDHAHGNGEAHEHATGAGLCGTRDSPHFTQDVSIGWTVTANGRGPRLSLQLDVENTVERGPPAVEGEHDGAGAVLDAACVLRLGEGRVLSVEPVMSGGPIPV